MTATKSANSEQDIRDRDPDLDRRYGKIGISAVAAAMRFQGEARNPDSYRFETYQRD